LFHARIRVLRFFNTGFYNSVRRLGMENSFWNTWTGFLAQMVFFALLGVLVAFAAKNLIGG
jgi:ABC-type multidrug transport system permease subunit